jgi:hypothetical protein
MNLTHTRWTEQQPGTELPVPPAAAEWREQQGLPPIDPPGRHDLDDRRARAGIPVGWPFVPMPPLPELTCDGLLYDQFGVIRPRKRSSGFRRHAARHSSPEAAS